MEFRGGGGGCCGRHALTIGGLDPKYEPGQGKLDYFEHSLLCAALSRSVGSSVSVQTNGLEGLIISLVPVYRSVCHVSLPCRRRCQLQIDPQGRACFVRVLQHNIIMKTTAVWALSGIEKLDTRPVNLGEQNENVKNIVLQARPWEPDVASDARAFDVSGMATPPRMVTILLKLQQRKQDRTGRNQDRKNRKQDCSGVKVTRKRSGWHRNVSRCSRHVCN